MYRTARQCPVLRKSDRSISEKMFNVNGFHQNPMQSAGPVTPSIDRQIAGLCQALQADSGGGRAGRRRTQSGRAKGGRGAKRGRKRMSPAERKAVSARMKAFWAKRRGGAKAKGSGTE